jgi:hypothetical protein
MIASCSTLELARVFHEQTSEEIAFLQADIIWQRAVGGLAQAVKNLTCLWK